MTIPEDTANPLARQPLLELATRCEREEQSRELDEAIAVALKRWGSEDDVFDWPPAFTSSLDAAVTLVPKGWRHQVIGWSWRTRKWSCELLLVGRDYHTKKEAAGCAPTEVQARVAAALRAHAGEAK